MCHADGLYRLIPKNSETLEDMVIDSLQAKEEILKHAMQYYARRNKNIVLDDNFIVEMKKKLKDRSTTEAEAYSICNDVLMYSERVVVPLSLQKRILKEFHTGHPGMSRMKSLMKSCVLAYRQKNR